MKNRILISLIFAAAVICGCSPDAVESFIEVTYPKGNVIVLAPEGGNHNIRFKAGLSWNVEIEDGWISASPTEGEAGMGLLKVKAEANTTGQKRTASLRLVSGNVEEVFTVEQEVFVPTFELVKKELSISASGGAFVVEVFTDVEYSYDIDADWISDTEAKAPSTNIHYFYAEANTLSEDRSAEIVFSSENQELTFTVSQRAAGTQSDDWMYKAFVHRSLAMRFTADWCGYCPYMATAFESAKTQMPGAFEILTLHADGGLVFSPSNTLASRFRVSGFPTGVVDSRASIPNYSSTAATAKAAMDVAAETQENYPATTGIAVDSYISGSELNVGVKLYFKEADKYRVTVLLLEDDIIGYQNGGGSNYEHDHVARHAFTSINGDPVLIEEDNTIWTSSYSTSVSSKYNKDNLRILVYVEKPFGERNRVENVGTAEYGDYGDTYVDNCRSAKVGVDAVLE